MPSSCGCGRKLAWLLRFERHVWLLAVGRVTVYGFGPEEAALVLRELQLCGTILNYGPFAGGARVNWLHVCFASRHDVQRALLKNGEQLSPTLIIGVKPLDPQQRCCIPGKLLRTCRLLRTETSVAFYPCA